MGEENEKFKWRDLWEKGKTLVEIAEDFKELDGSAKKAFVVDGLVELQLKYLNIPFLPDNIEADFSKTLIGLMVEQIVALLTKKGVINVGKGKTTA